MGSLPAADEQLVRELYAAHARPLLGYVRGLTGGDTGRAEDVVQEALLRAWQHPEAFAPDRKGRTSVRAWLFTVARNLVIDGERARRARPREVRSSTGADGVYQWFTWWNAVWFMDVQFANMTGALAAINVATPEGKLLQASAKQILRDLGRSSNEIAVSRTYGA